MILLTAEAQTYLMLQDVKSIMTRRHTDFATDGVTRMLDFQSGRGD